MTQIPSHNVIAYHVSLTARHILFDAIPLCSTLEGGITQIKHEYWILRSADDDQVPADGDGNGVVGGSKWCGIGGWWGLLPPCYDPATDSAWQPTQEGTPLSPAPIQTSGNHHWWHIMIHPAPLYWYKSPTMQWLALAWLHLNSVGEMLREAFPFQIWCLFTHCRMGGESNLCLANDVTVSRTMWGHKRRAVPTSYLWLAVGTSKLLLSQPSRFCPFMSVPPSYRKYYCSLCPHAQITVLQQVWLGRAQTYFVLCFLLMCFWQWEVIGFSPYRLNSEDIVSSTV